MELAGGAALVTGAASGLGAATADALAAVGMTVIALDRDPITDRPGIVGATADVTQPDSLAEALAAVSRTGMPLRLAVNCAGVAPSARILGRAGHHDLDLFRRVIDVNLVGTFNVMVLAAELMSRSAPDSQGQRGVIINTASIAAFDGQVGQVAYAASKGAIASMTLPAARDLASSGIRVCTVAPGIVDSPMMAGFSEEVRGSLAGSVPFPSRLANPSEFAQLVVMLASHDYMNGETVRMDGALRMNAR